MTVLLEQWKPIVGFESVYQITNLGVVVSKKSGKRLRCHVAPNGYLRVALCVGRKRSFITVHRISAEAFLGPRPANLQINHIDGDKFNNRASNLEYVTQRQNLSHARDLGKQPRWKLTSEDVAEIRRLRSQVSIRKLAKQFGIHPVTVYRIQIGVYHATQELNEARAKLKGVG